MTRRASLLGVVGALVAMMIASAALRSRLTNVSRPKPAGGVATTGSNEDTLSSPSVAIDVRRQHAVGVQTVSVERSPLERSVRTFGVVQYDQSRVVDVNLKVDGWIRELQVATTGQHVSKGQTLLSLYSPELLKLQTDYLLALRTRDRIRESAHDAVPRAEELVQTARRELELRDVSEADLRALDDARGDLGETAFLSPHAGSMTLVAPVSGAVIEKHVVRGLHVAAGDSLYRIADLSVVWIEAEVREVDVPLIRVGTSAVVTLEAHPGELRTGRVALVSPYLDEKLRTSKVRMVFDNRDGRLKPGMYASVDFELRTGVGLTVPADAVLDTGVEQVVFVAGGDGKFRARRVAVGPRFGDRVQIISGVTEGETVATGATFFLDSEGKLRGSPVGAPPLASADVDSNGSLVDIAFRTITEPRAAADTQFEVLLTRRDGQSVGHPTVALELSMPAMPSMNMPSMASAFELAPQGGGVFRGSGRPSMSGSWDALVIVRSGDVELTRGRFSLQVR